MSLDTALHILTAIEVAAIIALTGTASVVAMLALDAPDADGPRRSR